MITAPSHLSDMPVFETARVELSENPTLRPPRNPAKDRRRFACLFAINFLVTFGFAMMDPFFPLYVRDAGVTGVYFAVIFSAYTLSKMILSPWVGFWSDRTGRRKFMTAGLIFFLCASLLYLRPPDVLLLTVARIFQGIGAACFRIVALAAVGDQSPKQKEGSTIGTFDISFYSGLGLGPVAGGIIQTDFGIQGIFAFLVSICLVSLLLALLFRYPPPQGPPVQNRSRTEFPLLIRSKALWGLYAFILTRAMGISLFTIFLPLFMQERLHLTSLQIGVVMASGTVLMMLFLRPMGVLSDHRSRRMLVGMGGLLVGLLTCFIPLAAGFSWLLLLTLVLGLGSAITMPASAALLIEEGDRWGMGLVFGLFNTAMNIGFALAPFLGYFVMEWAGVQAVFYCSAIIGVAGVAMFYVCSAALGVPQTESLEKN